MNVLRLWPLGTPLLAAVTACGCGATSGLKGLGDAGRDGPLAMTGSADAGGDGSCGTPLGSVSCSLPDYPPVPSCGSSACGNGARDSCTSQACLQAPTCTVVETCDGADLGGATCASLGFSGGTLACSALCSFDTNQCQTCVSDPHTLACITAPLAADAPSTLALAATDQDIVVAWVAGPGASANAAGTVRVARFGADLSLIAEQGCIGPPTAQRVAIARSTTGYILAIDIGGSVIVQPLDSTGAVRGCSRVIANAQFPMLAPRIQGANVAGGPLLGWSASPPTTGAELEMRATILDDDGAETLSPVTVFPVTVQQPRANYDAVFTGDGFLVVAEGADTWLARLTMDGTVTRQAPPASAGDPEFQRLTWTGTEGRVVYVDLTGSVSKVLRVDKTGSPLGTPVALSGTLYLAPPVLAVGQDTVVVEGTGNHIIDSDSQLSVERVSPTGTSVTRPFAVVTDPEGVYQPKLALRGPDVVLAWVGGVYPGRIGLARLAP